MLKQRSLNDNIAILYVHRVHCHCLLHTFMGQNSGVSTLQARWGGQLLVSIIHDIIAKQTTGRVGRGAGAAPI